MKYIPCFLLAILCTLSTTINASDSGYGQATVGFFNEEHGRHSGLQISILGHIQDQDFLAGRISGVLMSERNTPLEVISYQGFSLTGFIHPNFPHINPYFGIGVFAGETYNCNELDVDGNCIEDVMLALFPEIGVGFTFGNFHFFPFVRRYYDSNLHAQINNAYGLNISFIFE